jgi:hypothetical protein
MIRGASPTRTVVKPTEKSRVIFASHVKSNGRSRYLIAFRYQLASSDFPNLLCLIR